jgi:hypothetical protein
MALGLYEYLREPPVADPEGLIRSQLENREKAFLETVRAAIFADPRNPYCQMFRLAGCGHGDLADAVRRRGLEATLADLCRQGVYLSHDEMKRKAPIIRSGREIPSEANSFANPTVTGRLESRSSGSRGAPVRARQSTRLKLYREAYDALLERDFGWRALARVELLPILPASWGLTNCLRRSRLGRPAEQWFSVGGAWRDTWHYRLATGLLVFEARAMGERVPFPAYLPPNDFSPVAEWISRRRAEGIASLVTGVVSPVVRVAAAAEEKGLDIRGTIFRVGGEALTDAKREVIEAAGGEVYSSYWTSELGPIGFSCREMRTGNSVHVHRDAIAVITRRRRPPFSEAEVDSLLFTTLLPFAPLVFINVEMDDAGVLGPAGCGCAFSAAGFCEQIADIYSYGKLTGQGTTLVGSDVVAILERALPARCGGNPGDYQLVEDEGGAQTRIVLRVSPRVSCSPEDVKQCFLDEVRNSFGGSLTTREWRHSEAVDVVMAEPLMTSTGKVLPLHLLGSGRRHTHAS